LLFKSETDFVVLGDLVILLIDNYDSFTYNLFQYISELGETVEVVRNDKITLDKISEMDPEKIVISPGPSIPDNAGLSVEIVREYGSKLPILGVCLGHQCIGRAYGGVVATANEIFHGKISKIFHDGTGLFTDIPNPFNAVRYHSLAITPDTLPDIFIANAWTGNKIIMGIKHKELDIHGIQFHPESVVTEHGKQILANFLKI